MAIRVTTGCRYLGNLLTTSTTSGFGVYPSCTPGCEAAISVLLSSTTCSAWGYLAAPLDAAMRLSGLTSGGFTGSNSATRFFLCRQIEGSAAKAPRCCGQGAGDVTETGAGERTDGLDNPIWDQRDGRGASCFLKLDISEKKQRLAQKRERRKIQRPQSLGFIPISSGASTSSTATLAGNSPTFLRNSSVESRGKL